MSFELPPLPVRHSEAHKGELGRVVLVAGSRGMAGAVVLAAEAAFRVGVGYVVIVAPGALAPELTLALPSAILALQGDSERQFLLESDWPAIQEALSTGQSLAVGPGLGQEPETQSLLQMLLTAVLPSTVLDADGLRALAKAPRSLAPEFILTPHPGEAAALLGQDSAQSIQLDRASALEELVNQYSATVLLKGAGTLLGAPTAKPWENETGNAGMATAGSGDVLTGILAGLLARGLSPWDAARLGAHLHGLAGDLAAKKLGEDAMLASDLLHFLPQAWRACASKL